ncbi:MAG: carbohydrate kinase family protein [Gaiellaceae bacterium]
MIVCIGIAARDTIYALPRHPAPDDRVVASSRVVAGGGPAATAAVTIARLGVPARFVGAIDDELDGVEVVRTPGDAVESTILVGEGTRAIVTMEPTPLTLEPDALADADWVHVDRHGYHAWRALGSTGPKVSIDASTPIDHLSLDGVDLYAPSERTYDGRRGHLTVVTKGAAGCTAYVEGETIDAPGFPVDAVSTLGAGDVFHGALLAGLWRELSVRDALVRANACAALSCRALDGRSAIPSWDELEAVVA